jgi:hypothetical protein
LPPEPRLHLLLDGGRTRRRIRGSLLPLTALLALPGYVHQTLAICKGSLSQILRYETANGKA